MNLMTHANISRTSSKASFKGYMRDTCCTELLQAYQVHEENVFSNIHERLNQVLGSKLLYLPGLEMEPEVSP